jgi:hypothetical protein
MIPTSLLLENSLSVYYFRADESRNIIYSNNLFESYADHIQPRKIEDVLKIDRDMDKALSAMEKAKLTAPMPVSVRCRLPQSTGAHRWSTWEVCYGADTYHWVGVQLFDVVSIKAHQYEEQNRLNEKIAWAQSHLVRRPLANILGLVSLMEKSPSSEALELIPLLSKSSKELDEAIEYVVKLASRSKEL